MNQDQITASQIETIQTAGFTKIKWYDEDLKYSYFDALLNESKVEVRMTEQSLEWRYLGIPIEEVEWFSIKTSQNTEEQNEEYISELNNDEKPFSSGIMDDNFIEPMEHVVKAAEPVTLETEIEIVEPITLETKVEMKAAEQLTLNDLFDVVAIGS
ncbi:hypothetical protein R3O67_28605 [Bacillus cereus]|uniref:hypothetical protein n=1 Tax=Bacillus cereus TaxID=1396 RepID=UPI00307A9A5C